MRDRDAQSSPERLRDMVRQLGQRLDRLRLVFAWIERFGSRGDNQRLPQPRFVDIASVEDTTRTAVRVLVKTDDEILSVNFALTGRSVSMHQYTKSGRTELGQSDFLVVERRQPEH